MALGTDTGGSIRIPAHYCATVGFKPSYGALPLAGVEALAPTLDHVGLLARDIAITTQAFAALTNSTPRLPRSGPLRVAIVRGQLDDRRLQPDVAAAVAGATEALVKAGGTVVELDGDVQSHLEATFSDILLFEAWQAHGWRVSANPDHYGPETLRLLQAGAGVSAEAYETALNRRGDLLPAASAMYNDVDVIVSPAAPFVAPVTTPPVDTPDGEAEGMFTAIYNLTGAPALVLPCGWSADGAADRAAVVHRPRH